MTWAPIPGHLGPAAKTIKCGNGPVYEVTAGATPDYIGPPSDSNVMLEYR
jgi:hypothetical protein